jgi:hypothetical protein
VDVDVLFAGVAVSDFNAARMWYECFFARARMSSRPRKK